MTIRFIAVLLIGAVTGCATPRYLAKVNDDLVDGKELKDEFKRRHGGHQRFVTADAYIARRFLDATIDRRLLLQEAYRIDLDDAPEIREETDELKVRKQVEQLVRVEVQEKSVPTSEEIQAAYDTRTEDLFLVREIVTKEREEADAALAAIEGGAEFDAVVRERSIADTRKSGGVVEVAWGARTEEWEAAVFALEPGRHTSILETAAGWEIVKLESKRKADKPEFAKAVQRIGTILQQRRMQERRREFLAELWRKHGASLAEFDSSLDALRLAREAKDPRVVARWSGGTMTLGEVAAGLDLDAVSRLARSKQRKAVVAEVEAAVNERVTRAEAAARGEALLTADASREVRNHRENLMEKRLYAEHVFREVTVTEADLKAYYEAHPAEFTLPESRHVAHIALDTHEAAEEVKAALAAGAPFDELARSRSKDPAAVNNDGDLGWVTKKDAPGELAAIFDVTVGETIGPLQTSFGHHVIKVLEVAPSRLLPLEAVVEEVRKKTLRAKNQERREAWVKQLRASARVSVSERALKKFLAAEQANEASALSAKAPASHMPQGHGEAAPASGHGGMPSAGHRGMPPPGHGATAPSPGSAGAVSPSATSTAPSDPPRAEAPGK